MKHPITRDRYEAVLFDMDDVITDTVSIHAACWKKMFDEFLRKWAVRNAQQFGSFDLDTDYKVHIDGKLRYEGVRAFLKSGGIVLPDGTPEDPPTAETVCGLGNRKNELVNDFLRSTGAEAYPGTVALLKELRRMGFKTAVVTSSQNCQAVLQAAKAGRRYPAVGGRSKSRNVSKLYRRIRNSNQFQIGKNDNILTHRRVEQKTRQ